MKCTHLDDDAKERLERVLGMADSVESIRAAVTDAIRGVNENGRRQYLRGILTREAASRIRRALKQKREKNNRKKENRRQVLQVTGSVTRDALRHEFAMLTPE